MKLVINWMVICFFILSSFLLFPSAKAETPTTVTYIALGDSLSAGYGSSEINFLRIHGFVPRFVQYLREDQLVHVENHSVPGLSSAGLQLMLETDIGLQNRIRNADIITMSIGGNDFINTVRANPTIGDVALSLRMSLLEENYRSIMNRIKELNSDAVVILLGLYNPYYDNHDLKASGEKFAPMFNEFINTFANSNTIIVNPYEWFNGKEKKLTHIADDDIHPNDEGYLVIHNLLVEQYEEYLKNN
ncbi:SGNH/GDSL hydrolase family protein [Bacillus sp. FJAT-45066]|uniref:SGNH/GDSL hydrolase family protein n=1 Tax=Bacillus sp. FJAT-45066 TaxID=2011010 RepID=UPI000BB6D758|nr:GDSL-type esterase/lipase family protein [Bacillus sp. FJAT-45066]